MNRWEQFNMIINDEDLSKDSKLLLLTIFRYINHETGYCTASTNTLMAKSKIGNRNTFSKARYELVMKGWIQFNSVRGKGSTYMITKGSEVNNVSKVNDSYLNNITFTSEQSNVSVVNYKKNLLKENKKENKLITSTTGTNSDLLNYIMSEDNPDYDYLHNFGWMYCEMSSCFIC